MDNDDYLVRLGQADRIKLTGLLLRHCHRPLLAAVLAAATAWGALVPVLWSLSGLRLAVPGPAPGLAVRLSVFFLGAGALGSVLLLSLNHLIDRCLEGEAPDGWEETVVLLLAPWSPGLLAPLGAWLVLAAAWGLALGLAWGAVLSLASLPPYAGLVPVLAGALVFAPLHNCAIWSLVRLEHEEPGRWAAVALPFRVLGHSRVLWRKTLSLGLLACLPGLGVTAAALSPWLTGFVLSGLVFLLGAALLAPGLAFFGCYFALAYRQALANYRLRTY